MRALAYNDMTSDRNVVATVQALEAILSEEAHGRPDACCRVNDPAGGLVMAIPGSGETRMLYQASCER